MRGRVDLRYACLSSVSVVGSRAASPYGLHIGGELAAALAERGYTVVSGGAFGIDSVAHRGALAADGITIAVLASGLSYAYPRGHDELFDAIAAQGALVSECPPDRTPTRPGFLIRNRLVAALSRGTVVVEAALRSGALSTAKHARELHRPLMAMPGRVTSEQSAGCHELIREWAAMLVTSATDVIEHVSPIGTELTGPRRRPGPAPRSPRPGGHGGAGGRAGARRPGPGQHRGAGRASTWTRRCAAWACSPPPASSSAPSRAGEPGRARDRADGLRGQGPRGKVRGGKVRGGNTSERSSDTRQADAAGPR